MKTVLAAACLAALWVANPVSAQDKAKPGAAPAAGASKTEAKDERDRKPLVDNEKVRVTESRYKPGASSGMRERGNRVVRALTDATLEKTWADGKKETITWKAGQVKYNPKETYSQKNIGTADVVLYSVTLK